MNTVDLKEALGDVIKAGLVPMIHSSPALGKSDCVRQVAKEYKLKLIDVRLSQSDPCDLLGLPSFNEDKSKAQYVPFDIFPLESDPIPEGYDGWLIFLDEMNAAPMSVQAAAFKITLDRMVGIHHLHKNVAIICAGNKASDKGITNRISTPMQSRLIHLELEVDHKSWITWASKSDIDHRIISFINFRPDNLYKFTPDHNDHTFPSPRTYEFLSKLIKYKPLLDYKSLALMAGTVGMGMAREFLGYTEIFKELPTLNQIIANPQLDISTEPSILYALTGLIAHNLSANNIDKLIIFIGRLPIEFTIITLRQALAREVSLMDTPAMSNWIANNHQELF